jgi:hypothetical protein
MSPGGPAQPPSSDVVLRTERVELLSVSGTVIAAGLDALRVGINTLLDAGTWCLIADLSGVTGCDTDLFTLLGEVEELLVGRRGWLRLGGLSNPVPDALDHASLPHALLVYRVSDRRVRTGVPVTVP